MDPFTFFSEPTLTSHKQYEALRTYFMEDTPAQECADRYGYSYRGFTSLVSTFRAKLANDPTGSFFFVEKATE